MKAVVATFNQEKALVGGRGLLHDYEPSDGPSFESLAGTRGGELHDNNIIGMVRLLAPVRQNKYLTWDQIHVVSTMGFMYTFSLNC